MKILSLTFSGFRGARGQVSLEFPAGFVVIAGRNGTGKSTICDAIEYALSGEIRSASEHKEKGEGIQDYIWWRGELPASSRFVELILIDDNGQRVVIHRTPTECKISPDTSLGNALCHGTGSLESPMSQLCRTSILRDEDITRLSVDLKETDRFEFVRSALGTADFSAVESKAKDVQDLVSTELSRAEHQYNAATARITDITTRLSEARSLLSDAADAKEAEDSLRRDLNAPSITLEELAKQAERRLSELRLLADGLVRLYSRLQGLEARIASLGSVERQAELQALNIKVEASRARCADIEKEIAATGIELAKLEADNPRTASLALLREHGSRLGLVDGSCPLCGIEQTKEHFESHLQTLAQVVAASNERVAAEANKSAELTTLLSKTNADLNAQRSQLATLTQQESELAKEREHILLEAGRLGVDHFSDGAMDRNRLGNDIESKRASILQIERALSIVQASRAVEQVANLEQELKAARDSHGTSDKRLLRVRVAADQIKNATDTIRRVRGEYINEQLAKLEPLLVELYQRLRPHVDWPEVRYRLRGDVRRMLSLEIGDGLNPSFIFSSGQRRAAGLAFLLALHLSRDWCNLQTLILDDPVQHIDDYRALHLTEVLAAIRCSGRQVICTVEDRSLSRLLARRLRSESDEGGMTVNMGYSSQIGVHIESCTVVQPFPSHILVSA